MQQYHRLFLFNKSTAQICDCRIHIMFSTDMVSASLGKRTADTVILDCRMVCVYTGEIIPHTQISISADRISYVGPDASHTVGPHTHTVHANGRYAVPGLADPHTHIDQFMLPGHTATAALSHGTTTLFSDPIDITGIAGYDGLEWFVKACGNQPVRIFNAIPGGQPVDPQLGRGRTLNASEQRTMLKNDAVFGMGEVFSWTKVTDIDPYTMESLDVMREVGVVTNGHTAGMRGAKLAAYAASGIASCHEPIDYEQTIERLRLGLYVMVREGSIRRDLYGIMREISSKGTYTGRLMFCTDGLNPVDMKSGHMDHCIREAIRARIDPVDAVRMATLNVFEYYNMNHNLGGIAPGRLADIILLDELESFRIHTVWQNGKVVVADGRLRIGARHPDIPRWLYNTMSLEPVSAADFEVPHTGDTASVNTIRLKTEIITSPGIAELPVHNDHIRLPGGDLWKVAALDRVHGSGHRTIGFLEGFGEGNGAVASSASFHENDLIVIGNNEHDMAAAANHTIQNGGGMAVAQDDTIQASLGMPVGGIMSDDSADVVRERFVGVRKAMQDIGCKYDEPHLIMLFLPFLALPHIRILSGGIVNVRDRSIIPTVRKCQD